MKKSPQTSHPKISVKGLHKSFGSNHVLQGISFDLKAKESLVIIGGSGTGKSVLIKCILGLVNPDKGTIQVDGENVVRLGRTEKNTLMRRVGMLFQGGALFDSMTIGENVAFGLVQGLGMPVPQAKEVALEKLKAVNLDASVAKLYPAELSGGMQKRVALARAIAGDPEIIFFDEPTAGLDPITSGTINDLIRQCVTDLGATTVTITHDLQSLRAIATHVALLHEGQFIWEGTLKEMEKTKDPYMHQFLNGLPNGPFTTPQEEPAQKTAPKGRTSKKAP